MLKALTTLLKDDIMRIEMEKYSNAVLMHFQIRSRQRKEKRIAYDFRYQGETQRQYEEYAQEDGENSLFCVCDVIYAGPGGFCVGRDAQKAGDLCVSGFAQRYFSDSSWTFQPDIASPAGSLSMFCPKEDFREDGDSGSRYKPDNGWGGTAYNSIYSLCLAAVLYIYPEQCSCAGSRKRFFSDRVSDRILHMEVPRGFPDAKRPESGRYCNVRDGQL